MASCPTRPTGSTAFFKQHPTSTAFCAAQNLSTCRCRRRPSTSWSSTSQHGDFTHAQSGSCEVARKPGGRRLRRRLLMLALRYIHDHPSGKIKTRLDRIDLDILGIVRMGAKTAQPEPFNDRRLGLERREGRVGAAAFGHVADPAFCQSRHKCAGYVSPRLAKPGSSRAAAGGARMSSRP